MSYLADRQRLYGSATPDVQSDPGGGGEDEGDWPNGFAYRADIIIPASQIAATMSSVMVCVAVNTGGNSENSGADIRFETQGGAVLDYALHRYAANVAYCVVRIPTLTASTQYKFHCYVGDSGATGQTNAAGAYAQFIAAWDEDGNDLTGHGWNLTATGAGTSTAESGFPCSTFDLGDVISSNDVLTTWDGLTGWTMEALVERDTAAETATIFGAGSAPGFYTQYAEFALNQSGAGSPLVLASSSLVEGSTSTYAVGPANSAALLGETAYASSWAQGAAPTLYLGGAAQSALASNAQSAPTDIYPAQAGIRLGQRLDGKLAFVRVAGSAFPAAKIAFHARSMRDPAQVYGIGALYGPDDEGSPPIVALPLTANVSADAYVDIDVAASAVTGGTATLQSVTQGSRSGSSVTIESGVARYTPGGTQAGTDRFAATVSDGTNTSVARVTVAIAASSVAPPAADWNEVAVSSYAELTAAVAAANPGDDIVLDDGTYTGNLTISRSGVEGAPIRVRSATLNGARIIGIITVTGSRVIVQGLKWQSYSGGNAIVDIYGDFVQIRGNQFIDCAVGNGAQRGAVRANAGANDGLIEYNEFRRFIQRAVCVRSANAGALRWTVRRNLFHTNIPSPGTLYSGIACGIGGDEENQTAWAQNMQCVVEYNYFTGIGGTDGNILQFKTSGCIARQNTAEDCPEGRMEDRRGGWTSAGVYNQWIANTLINSRGPLVFGPDHIVNSNYNDDQVLGNWKSMGPGSGDIVYTTINNKRPHADSQKWVNNTGRLHKGQSASDPYPALDTNIYNHTGTIVDTNSSGTTSSDPGIAAVTRVVLTAADVGPSQMPAEPENATVADFWANPFSAESVHHRPVGDSATYAAATSAQSGYEGDNVFEEWAAAGIGSISGGNGNQFGVPIGYEAGGEPSRTITISSGSLTSTLALNVSNDFPFYTNSVSYGEATNWIAADFTAYDIYNHMRSSDGATRTASLYRTCDVRGLGHALTFADSTRYGSSASGCSTMIGVMRKSEIETPGLAMRHVLHLVLPRGESGHSDPQGLSKRVQVPARYVDATAHDAAKNLGPIPYGGHVGIPPADLTALHAAINATSSSAFTGSTFGDVGAYEAAAKEAMVRVATQCCHYGCIAIDGGAVPQFRADLPFTGYLAQAMMVIMRQSYWWDAFKLITNAVSGANVVVNASGTLVNISTATPSGTGYTGGNATGATIGTRSTNTVGGGTALAPNSALVT